MLLSVAARQIVRVRGHGAASVRRLGKKDVGLGTGWVAGRAQSVSQSVRVCNVARIKLGQKLGVGRVLTVAHPHHLYQSTQACEFCTFLHKLKDSHYLQRKMLIGSILGLWRRWCVMCCSPLCTFIIYYYQSDRRVNACVYLEWNSCHGEFEFLKAGLSIFFCLFFVYLFFPHHAQWQRGQVHGFID